MTWQVGLYVAAVLIPLAAFTIELLFSRLLGRFNAVVATGAIGLSFLLSLVGFIAYFSEAEGVFAHPGPPSAEAEPGAAAHEGEGEHGTAEAEHHGPLVW